MHRLAKLYPNTADDDESRKHTEPIGHGGRLRGTATSSADQNPEVFDPRPYPAQTLALIAVDSWWSEAVAEWERNRLSARRSEWLPSGFDPYRVCTYGCADPWCDQRWPGNKNAGRCGPQFGHPELAALAVDAIQKVSEPDVRLAPLPARGRGPVNAAQTQAFRNAQTELAAWP